MTYIFVSLLLLVALYPVWVVHKQTQGSPETVQRTPKEWGAEYEEISYLTPDGLTLRGWMVPAGGEKAVLLLHGNGGSRNGFSSGIFDLGEWYHKEGYSVMMADLRAHGESEGDRIYFGIKESEDMAGWLAKIDPTGSFSWTLHGFSMGAVTALMMKERDPKRFEKVVADAPWIDFEMLSKQELWRRGHLPPLFYGYVKFIAWLLFDIDFKRADNRRRCEELCGSEILYIFESDDRLVTKEHPRKLRRICPKAEIAEFEGVGHVEAFKERPKLYTERLLAFLRRRSVAVRS